MAKKTKQPATAPISATVAAPPTQSEPLFEKGFSLHHFKVQCIIIAVIGLLFYANTFSNEFALDDRPIIIENEFVKAGFAGIPKILTSDAFASYLNQQNSGNALSGGRYRPLSIVTFAIEQQFLGTRGAEEVADSTREMKSNALTEAAEAKIKRDMHVRHVINVLLYIFSVMVILYFLRKVLFPGNTVIPFIGALIFLIHPIHTEVVANVKSRDEILSLLFICLTFTTAFSYFDTKNKKQLYLSLFYFLLALLSKEYALLLLGLLVPIVHVLRPQEDSIAKRYKIVLPYIIPFCIYMVLRLGATKGAGDATADIMNMPYLFATPVQKFASIVSTLLTYIKLLLLPHPLVSDYSYNQIPYRDLTYPLFWLSLAVYGALVWLFFYLYHQRHILFFAVAFFLAPIAMIGNVIINIGAPMGERLVYHSSLGFAIIVAYLLYQAIAKMKSEKLGYWAVGALLALLTVFAGAATIARNAEWKNDKTLYLADVKKSPRSVLILGNAGSASIDLAESNPDSTQQRRLFEQGITYFNKAIAIHPAFFTGYLNKGVALYKLGYPEQALECWDSVRKYYPDHPTLPYVTKVLSNLYYGKALKWGRAGQHDSAAYYFSKASRAKPDEADVWFNLGFAKFSAGRFADAASAFETSLKLDPNNKSARNYYEQAKSRITPTSAVAP
jgi:protein O-mannosyl-transferase